MLSFLTPARGGGGGGGSRRLIRPTFRAYLAPQGQFFMDTKVFSGTENVCPNEKTCLGYVKSHRFHCNPLSGGATYFVFEVNCFRFCRIKFVCIDVAMCDPVHHVEYFAIVNC